ncbi:MAG: flagellar basal body L-ring protein FlgH [Jannaschia sp.]
MHLRKLLPLSVLILSASACGRISDVGRAPELTPIAQGNEHMAMAAPFPIAVFEEPEPMDGASLWTAGRQSLLGDRRASERGDIMTVVIEIDENAEINNSTNRSRSGSESMAIPELLGLPQSLDRRLPEGASLANAVSTDSSSASQGQGGVRRQERLTLRIAATVTGVLPTGVLQIEGRQEVRVNFELREMLVTGYVRPNDVSRQNEITYDKIASARISYGGRGQITDVQQPRYGQQVADILLPF